MLGYFQYNPDIITENNLLKNYVAQLVGEVEYISCISAVG